MSDVFKDLNELCLSTYELAKLKGWYDSPRAPLEVHMLIVSEIAEASEAVRNGDEPFYFQDTKPEGELTELADAVIRILDYCGSRGWELGTAMKIKQQFNSTRPYKHGKLL